MRLSLWRLGDSDCIRSVRVPSRNVYLYTRAGGERACVEVRPLVGLLMGEEMWCICGMLQYSPKSKINLFHWHSIQHVRHILIDCHGVDVWAVNGVGISILGRGSTGDVIRPNTPVSASCYFILNFRSPSCNVLVASLSFFLRPIPILIDFIIKDKLRKNDWLLHTNKCTLTYILRVCNTVCCILCNTVYAYTVHSTHAPQVILCNPNTDNVCTTSMYPRWTSCAILAKYWLWLPDDGFLVNRNMLEQPPPP
jgi:hypothetical protein